MRLQQGGILVRVSAFVVILKALIFSVSYTDIGRHINKLINVS